MLRCDIPTRSTGTLFATSLGRNRDSGALPIPHGNRNCGFSFTAVVIELEMKQPALWAPSSSSTEWQVIVSGSG